MVRATPEASRLRILELRAHGHTLDKIAKILNISRSTVQRILKKVKEKGTIGVNKRSGRPKKLSPSDRRRIAIHAKMNPLASQREIKEQLKLDVSTWSIRQALREHGLRSYVVKKKPFLSKRNQQKRLAYAKQYVEEDNDFWHNVLWTDESKMVLMSDRRNQFIIRRKGQAFNPTNIDGTFKHSPSFMVWGAFAYGGVGQLAVIDGKMDSKMFVDIVEKNVIHSVPKIGLRRSFVLQMDNDPKHTSKYAGVLSKTQMDTPSPSTTKPRFESH